MTISRGQWMVAAGAISAIFTALVIFEVVPLPWLVMAPIAVGIAPPVAALVANALSGAIGGRRRAAKRPTARA